MALLNGITFFRRTDVYDGDTTKNCGLTGGEIDDNFYFLRGNDIDEIKWNSIDDSLTFKRVNGSECTITGITDNIKQELSKIDTSIDTEGTYYDVNSDTFHLVINGIDTTVTGFSFNSGIVFTDSSLDGLGNQSEPLKLNETLKTGFLKPCIAYIDTFNGETLPLTPEVGDTYITKDVVIKNGLLYNYYAMDAISQILSTNKSKWRVPSVDEWSEMLNAIEIDDEYRNHKSQSSNAELGQYAGLFLKSKHGEWDEFVGKDYVPTDSYGFNALPSGVSELGEQKFYGRRASFWTNTIASENSDIWVKSIDYDKETVQQQAEGRNNLLSIRLIRDYNDTYSHTEDILGKTYKVVPMPFVDSNGNNGTKIWTSQNIEFDDVQKMVSINDKSVISTVDADSTSDNFAYYINSWDGKRWEKRQIEENTVLVIKNGPNGVNDQDWQLIDGVLRLRSEILSGIIVGEVKPELDGLKDKMVKMGEGLMDILNSEVGRIDDEISSEIEKESNLREGNDINTNNDYELSVTDGVTLKTNSGKNITITFNGNFGEF